MAALLNTHEMNSLRDRLGDVHFGEVNLPIDWRTTQAATAVPDDVDDDDLDMEDHAALRAVVNMLGFDPRDALRALG